MNTKVRYTSHFLVKLLILSTTYFVSGCMASTIKHYGYTKSAKEFEWGKMEVRLDGEYKTVSDDEEVYSTPYKLKVFL